MNYIKVLQVANGEIGYTEKDSKADIYIYSKSGTRNFTKYAQEEFPELQGQPWCDVFVDWCFIQAYGRKKAEKLLGGFSGYTPTSESYFRKMKQNVSQIYAEPGDVIFFKNSIRTCHTGIVLERTASEIFTIEGNTSPQEGVVSNGGMVCMKRYPLSYNRISSVGSVRFETTYMPGWNKDSNGWFYVTDTENSIYYQGQWADINHHRYYFNNDGYAVTDWNEIDGKWYYFEPRPGHPFECALYTSDDTGVQEVKYFE